MEGDRLLGQTEDLDHAFLGDAQDVGDLLGGRLDGVGLEQGTLQAYYPVHQLDDVDGDADGAGLVSQRPAHRLADPPGRVRGELVAARVVELLHRADQAEVALLHQVQDRHAAADVALGDRYDEAEVRLDQLALGGLAVQDQYVQIAAVLGAQVEDVQPLLVGEQAGLDGARELDLLHRGQQRDPADL